MNTLIETLKYFVFITAELIALFLLISAVVEIILMYIPQDKIKQWLSGRGILGNVMAAGFGALTPFCACSTIPMTDRKSTRLNSSHPSRSRMPSSA